MPQVREYSDLNLAFIAHPVSGDVSILRDAEAVKRSLKNLVFTNYYERFYQPGLGCGINHMLFEPIMPFTAKKMKNAIIDVINTYEPRVELINVDVEPDGTDHGFQISLKFYVLNIPEPVELDLFLQRAR